LLAEDVLSAYDNWYATTCRQCAAGCGAIVRVVDGRARKVEGNPDHPLNQGKLCARGQAIVQEQYHPDRMRGPLQREQSSGSLAPVAWSTALDTLIARLRDLRTQGRAADVSLITPPLGGHQAVLVDRFAGAYGLKWLPFEPISEAPLREASRRVFGFAGLPRFDIARATTVLSFGADFLGSWLSPVRFGIDYGVFRQGSYDVRAFQPRSSQSTRGRLIHVDTHFSSTAASADEWIWVRPGSEGVLALSIANALGASGLDAFAPEQTAAQTSVDPLRVRSLANELRQSPPALVIGGGSAGSYTTGTDAVSAILNLNQILGNVGQPGGVLAPSESPLNGLPNSPARPVSDWTDLVSRMADGREQAVLLLGGANPLHGLPAALGFREALQRVPFIGSFGSFADDTSMLAHLVLPSSLALEDWGDAAPDLGASSSVVSVQQPVVSALFDTRSVWDVLLAVADELGDPVRQALPWPTFKDLLQDQLDAFRPADVTQARFWTSTLQRGFISPPPAVSPALSESGGNSLPPPETGRGSGGGSTASIAPFAGDPQTYPYYLAVFPHNTLGSGSSAHLPWLQATPDPLTSVTWQTWVELSPGVASSLNVQEGDIVAVESPRGYLEAPAYISPAAPPEVVAIPLGQGHSGFGRWADGRGANPMQLLEPLADTATGALAYGSTRVNVVRTGRKSDLPKLEGSAPVRQLPGQEVVKVSRA
jgi:anaerobic selenocysteine-containing dehydrogenase